MKESIWSASRRIALVPVNLAICRLPLPARRRALFMLNHARLPHAASPVSFNEKVNWRILNDRRPLLEWTCDKIAMKEHAGRVPDLHIPKTLWSGTDVRTLALANLPEQWVLKPNHRSGLVYFGTGQPEIAQLEVETAGWLRENQYEELGEWAYSKSRPLILAEELIGAPGSPPPNYKFFVFEGDVAAILVSAGRYVSHQLRMYLPDWTPLDVRYGAYSPAPVQPPPASLDRMMAIASDLGSEFDFMRIDLYDDSGSIFFGEYTPYVCSGLIGFRPRSFDADLGRKWRLPDLTAAAMPERRTTG